MSQRVISCGALVKTHKNDMEINIVTKWVLERLNIEENYQHHWALLLSALLIPLLVPLAVYVPHFCLLRFLFGMPCPGCGILHSLIAMLHFNLNEAWVSNPAGVGLFLLFGFQILGRSIALMWSSTSKAVTRFSNHAGTAVTAWLFFVWCERLITGGIDGGYFLPKM